MKGLLIKDLYELWGQAKMILILIVVYIVIGEFSPGISSVALLLCAMLPTSCIGYDERAKWDRYARSMPLSVRDLVVSKYLLGYLALAAGAVIRVIVMLLPFGSGADFTSLLSALAVALLYMALQLPILFRCGTESGRIWLLLISGAFAVGIVTLGMVLPAMDLSLLPYILVAAAVVVQVPSILLAGKLYRTH